MVDQVLTAGWRAAFGIAGGLMLVSGIAALPGEILWAVHGAPLAWGAVPIAAVLAGGGALLTRAAIRGRVKQRNLVIGRPPGT